MVQGRPIYEIYDAIQRIPDEALFYRLLAQVSKRHHLALSKIHTTHNNHNTRPKKSLMDGL